MTVEENKTIARRIYEIITTGEFDRAEEIVDREVPDNELRSGDPPAKLIETFKETFSEAREAFPDMRVTVEKVIAEGDTVAARVTWRATHKGEMMAIPATGREVTVSGMRFFRVAGDRIVEEWASDDMLGLMQQLGAIPAPTQTASNA